MNYPIADFVNRIKNASLARRREVMIPNYRINKVIGKLLVKEGFLSDIKEEKLKDRKVLVLTLRYKKRSPVLIDAVIVSKPSLRIYTTAKTIPLIQRKGKYTIVLSTNKGITTAKEAYKKGIGGEVLFKIW